jgi:SHS2 domain-containing protein
MSSMNDIELPDDAIRIVEHTADWALHVRGPDLAGLFGRAAAGMARLLAGDGAVPLEEARELALAADDAESLLVEFLGELAYWAERDGLVCPVVALSEVSPTMLRATARGGRLTELQKHIKAVTYHDLSIRPYDGGLEVTIVFDV